MDEYRVIFLDHETRFFRPVPVERPIKDGQIALLPSILKNRGDFWRYHFILLNTDGMVYDPFLGNSPIAAGEYFEKVFPQSETESPAYFPMDRLKHLYIRVVPAREFIVDFETGNQDEVRLADQYKKHSDDRFPKIRVRDFLKP